MMSSTRQKLGAAAMGREANLDISMMATQQTTDTTKNDGSDLQNTPIVSSFVGGIRYREQYEQDNLTISHSSGL
jgi:hypothetical protein